jgi:uncharacterized protein (TIGR02145 family)
MLEISGNIAKINGNWLNAVPGVGPQPDPPTPGMKTVTIGTQKWTVKNLAVDDGGSGIVKLPASANGVDFGTQYYYTWEAANRVAATIDGFHLPSSAEWITLYNYVGKNGGGLLKSTTGWTAWQGTDGNGTDDFGFTALPTARSNNGTSVYMAGSYTWMWSSNEEYDGSATAVLCSINNRTSSNIGMTSANKGEYLTIRLIKDS